MSAPPKSRTDSTTLDAAEQPALPKHPPTSHRSDHPVAGHSSDQTAPPDWSMVPFPVECPRCGHGLNGSTDAACSACGLELHWPDVVPIEKLKCKACRYPLYGLTTERCPECGEPFTWESALERYHRTNKNLFEYRWREAPLRSLWSSFRLSLNTRKTWEVIQITDPPPTRPLLWMLAIGILFGAGAPFALWMASDFALTIIEDMTAAWWIQELRWYYGVGEISWPLAGGLTFSLIAWCGGGLGSLLCLRWSMAACRVKNGHVTRAFVYSVLPVFIVPGLADAAYHVIAVAVVGTDWGYRVIYWLQITMPPLALVGQIIIVWRIRFAYRAYIRMAHAWAVAILTQIIAFVCLMIAATCHALFS